MREEQGADRYPEELVLEGRAWVFGDGVDADWHICTLDRLAELKACGAPLMAATLGRYCLEGLDPSFAQRVARGDVLVAGENFGCSSACLDGDPDDPHLVGAASLALKGAGIAAVVCESANATFLRNSLHHGLPVVECRGVRSGVDPGDTVRVEPAAGRITNLSTGRHWAFKPYPPFLLEMLRAGGIYPQLQRAG